MSQVDDLVFLRHQIDSIALEAIYQAKAGYPCPDHSDVMLSGAPEAENRSYAIATNLVRKKLGEENRQLVIKSVKSQLAEAPYQCPLCEVLLKE